MPKHLTVNDEDLFLQPDQINQPNGVAGLDGTGKIPEALIPGGTASSVLSVNGMDGDVLLSAADVNAIPTTQRGAANGVASLDASTKLPVAQLPSVAVQSVNGYSGPSVTLAAVDVGALTQTTGDARYLQTAQRGAASGVASLDSSTLVPVAQVPPLPASQINSGTLATARIPDLSATYLAVTQKAAANGVASLDASTLVPVAQIPPLPASQVNSGTFSTARIPDLSATYVAVTQKGAASGVATLDGSTLVPVAQVPPLPASQISSGTLSTARIPDLSATYIATTQKAAASGVASLDSSTLVPVAQIPPLPASQISSGTLGTARIPDLSATYIAVTQKAAASGVASLDSGTKVPTAQIPDLSGTYTTLASYGNTWMPADHGLIAWTMDPGATTTSGTTLSAGFIYMLQVVLRTASTLAKVNAVIGTAGATLTSGQCLAGLYTTAGTRVAITADMSTTWNSAGNKTMNFTGSYSAAAGKYYIALLFNGTTSPTFACGSTLGATFTPGNANLSAGSYRWCRSASGQTSLPSSVTLSGYTPDANNIYAAVG